MAAKACSSSGAAASGSRAAAALGCYPGTTAAAARLQQHWLVVVPRSCGCWQGCWQAQLHQGRWWRRPWRQRPLAEAVAAVAMITGAAVVMMDSKLPARHVCLLLGIMLLPVHSAEQKRERNG